VISKLKTFITASSLIALITPTVLMGETTAKSIGHTIDNSVIKPIGNWFNKPGNVKIPAGPLGTAVIPKRDLKIGGVAAGGALAVGGTAAAIRAGTRATGGTAAPVYEDPEEDVGDGPIIPTQAQIDAYLEDQAKAAEAAKAGEAARAAELAGYDAKFAAEYPGLKAASAQYEAGEQEALRQLDEGKNPWELVKPEGNDINFSRGFRTTQNRAIIESGAKPPTTSAPDTTSPKEIPGENTPDDIPDDSGFAPGDFGGETDDEGDDLSQAIARAKAGQAADASGIESASQSGGNTTADALNAGTQAAADATQAVQSATNELASGPYEDEGAEVGDITGAGDAGGVGAEIGENVGIDAIE